MTNPLSLNLYTYVENNPLIYVDPTGNYKMSDNNELKSMVEMFGNQWQDANKIGDKAGMTAAEKAADAVRVSYYSLQSKGLPSDVKYTDKGLEDVTDKLNGLMLKYEYVYDDRTLLDIKEFYQIVRNGAELDLKNQGWTSSYYVYNKQIVEKDVPGNISFGYVGKVFDIPDTILVAGAGFAQIRAETSKREWVNLKSFGDDPRDTFWINYGIDLYNSWHRK